MKTWTLATKFLGEWKSPVFVFLGLTFVVVFPLFLKPGFVFLLDWTPSPQPSPLQWGPTGNYIVFNFVWWFLDFLLPGGFLQKVLLSISLFLAGFGMFRLGVMIRTFGTNHWGGYFGGIFYMFNPFVYSRVLIGQWNIIIAYALLPWFFLSLVRFFKFPSFRSAGYIALWWTAILFLNLHIGILAFLLLVFASTFYFLFSLLRSKEIFFRFWKYFSVFVLSFLVLNFYWIFPAIIGTSTLNNYTENIINQTDISSFLTRSDPQHGVLWNTAAMYGFWGDDDMRYVPQKMMVPYWFWLYFVILAFVLWGVVSSASFWLKKERDTSIDVSIDTDDSSHETKFSTNFVSTYQHISFKGHVVRFHGREPWIIFSFMMIGIVSFILAIGIAHPLVASISQWLYNHFPLYRGFREPQKWIGLLVMSYAYLGTLGVDDLISRMRRGIEICQRHVVKSIRFLIYFFEFFKKTVPAFFLVIPLLYSPGMLWGFQGQLCVSDYPESWSEINRFLNEDRDNFRMLFLPWHLYMNFSFACNRVVNNPAERFFDKPTIAGDNMEFGSIYTQSPRPESKFIEQEILGNKLQFIGTDGQQPEMSLGEKLNTLNIKYVIWAEESDFFNYDFVSKSPDLELVYEGERIKLYHNTLWKLE